MTTAIGNQTEMARRSARRSRPGKNGTGSITHVFAPEIVWRIKGCVEAVREQAAVHRRGARALRRPILRLGGRLPSGAGQVGARRRRHRDRALGRPGTANDGKPYENSYAWFMKMRDGKVVDGTAFYDSISFDEFWSRVQAR